MTDLDAFANGRDEAVGVKSVRSTMVSLQAGFFSLLNFVGAGYLMVSLNSGTVRRPGGGCDPSVTLRLRPIAI